jgi:CubicO group peptidase (beta-lactamase class C family)
MKKRIIKCCFLNFRIVAFGGMLLLAISVLAQTDDSGDRAQTELLTTAVGTRNPIIDIEELASFVDEVIPSLLEQFHAAGVMLTVVQNGELLLARGYGYADFAARKAVVADKSLFQIGSVSKLFTWTSVMQLVEKGKLDLDTDVNKYLTQFQIPETFDEPVTLRHLLTHTAGFEDGGYGWLFTDSPENLVPLSEFLEAHVPIRYGPPGEFSNYSNWGAALAGLIVANVSGQSFDEYVDAHIFEPLAMSGSTFREPVGSQLEADTAIGHRFDGQKIIAGYRQYLHNIGPAGSMRSTATDMGNFMIAQTQGGLLGDRRILQPETVAQMHRTQFTHDPVLPGMGFGFMLNQINGYRVSAHAGATSFFNSNLILLPDENVGMFVSFNSQSSFGAVRSFSDSFMNRFFPSRAVDNKTDKYITSSADLDRLEGLYKPMLRMYSTWGKASALLADTIAVAPDGDGNIIISSRSGTRMSYEPIGPLVYKKIDGDALRVFRAGDNGSITHMFDSSFSAVSLEKISWVESGDFYKKLGLLVCILASTALIASRRVWTDNPDQQRTAIILSVVSGAMIPLAFWVFATAFTNPATALTIAIPIGIEVALTMPLLIAACTVWLGWLVFKAWSNRSWSGVVRLQYTAILVGLLAFLSMSNYWNVLGYKFG